MTDFSSHTPPRPKFLNLLKIHMPVNAVVSILHRVSGFLLFICLPLVIYWLGLSLRDQEGFQSIVTLSDSLLFRVIIGLILFNLFYHLFAGVRFLFMDINLGQNLASSRLTAWLVMIISVLLAGFMVMWVLL